MIIVMKRGATPEQIQHVIDRVEELGLKSHPIQGTERTVIAAIGDRRGVDVGFFTAALSGYLCIRFLLRFLQKNSTDIFVYYRWVLALIVLSVAFMR